MHEALTYEDLMGGMNVHTLVLNGRRGTRTPVFKLFAIG